MQFFQLSCLSSWCLLPISDCVTRCEPTVWIPVHFSSPSHCTNLVLDYQTSSSSKKKKKTKEGNWLCVYQDWNTLARPLLAPAVGAELLWPRAAPPPASVQSAATEQPQGWGRGGVRGQGDERNTQPPPPPPPPKSPQSAPERSNKSILCFLFPTEDWGVEGEEEEESHNNAGATSLWFRHKFPQRGVTGRRRRHPEAWRGSNDEGAALARSDSLKEHQEAGSMRTTSWSTWLLLLLPLGEWPSLNLCLCVRRRRKRRRRQPQVYCRVSLCSIYS